MLVHAHAAQSAKSALTPFTYESEGLRPYDVVVRVETCGICHSDIHMIDNDWTISRYPLVPGHEIVGEVQETGALVRHIRVGERVGIGWQREACLECTDCLRGDENLCENQVATIVGHHGGFADFLRVDSRFCFPIPAGLESAAASPLLCAGITVYSGLRHAGMTSGQRVGIIGVGGLGHLAVQFAAKLGNHVTVFTGSADKAEEAAGLGASDAILTRGARPGRTRERFDILLCTAPQSVDWNAYLNLLDSDGTLCLVGVPNEPLTFSAGTLLARRRRIMASPIGGRALIQEMLKIADRFGVRPRVEEFPMAQANAALDRVRANAVRYRAVLRARA